MAHCQSQEEIQNEEAKVNTEPSEAQKEAGNYKMGHVKIQGLDITIEQPKGSVRSGVDENGKQWSQTMNNTYGYIRGTESRDGDHIDIFLGDNPNSTKVFVVDQVNTSTREFDEHKVMVGFDSIDQARDAYLSNYEDGWKGLGNITETDIDLFKKWSSAEGRRIKPYSEYKVSKDHVSESNAEYTSDSLEKINNKFNTELQRQIDGTLPSGHVYQLGMPSDILLSTGIANRPIRLSSNRLQEKATSFGHDYDLSEIRNLPKAINNPIAVFEYGDKKKSQNIITEIEDSNGKKFLVGISITPKVKGEILEINSIRNVFPKDTHEWIHWIMQNKGLYYDKKRLLSFLDQQRTIPADVAFGLPETQAQQENLEVATNIINSFENPKVDSNVSEPISVVAPNAAQLQIDWNSPVNHISNLEVDKELESKRKEIGYNAAPQEESVTYSERQLIDQGNLTFMGDRLTGAARIQSSADIAFLFKNLESAATENAFAVLIKSDGTYSVLYLSTGATTFAVVDIKQIVAAAHDLSASKVVLVHNHPSGNLLPSNADYKLHDDLSKSFVGTDIELDDSIIINLDSGKYTVFDERYHSKLLNENPSTEIIEPPIYKFDRQVLYVPSSEKHKILNSDDIAKFLSIQKRGIVPKIQLLVLGQNNAINKYVALDSNMDKKELIAKIIYEVGKHGEHVVLASNGSISESDSRLVQNALRKYGINLLDVLMIKQDEDILSSYTSYSNEGVLEPESKYETQNNRVEDSLSKEEHIPDGTIQEYEKALKKKGFKPQEAFQDSMLSLKVLQEIIERMSGKKLKSFENAYMAENQMSSRSAAESEKYGDEFFKPLVKEIGKLMNNGASYQGIIHYMMAKHGLERNDYMARREADQWLSEQVKPIEKKLNDGNITSEEFDRLKDGLQVAADERYTKNTEKDYSGLSALMFNITNEEKGNFTEFANGLVDSFEKDYDTSVLWKKTNAATKKTLRKAYESGMMSKEVFDHISDMYQYYIPLRGWNETTADEVYEYLTSSTSSVNSILKKTGGRKSMADDPIATIGNMAESTILQGNRNLMKQHFLNMAINHPTDLITIKEAWYEKRGTPEDPKWVASYPNISDNATAEQVSQAVSEHEELMKQLKSEGRATKKTTGLNIDYKINTRQINEHIVQVKRNGKDYILFVNGNPRAAQAVNGLTNPEAEGDGWADQMSRAISSFNRQLAANFTTRNPAFVFSNLTRDMIYSVSASLVKESPLYSARFITNIPKSMRYVYRGLSGKFEKDRELDVYWNEFIDNGGETGYTALHNIDQYKKMIKKELGKITNKTDYFKAVKACSEAFGAMNRWAEDVSRFNAYVTSRQEGRSITESINDAKEITVNFNKKGSGSKTSGAFGFVSGALRGGYLFFNAGVQGLANFGKLYDKNKVGFYTLLGGFTTAGFLQPMLNSWLISMFGDDGDDDYYANLPEWVRRNNLCLYKGGGQFITIPLPIELRAFFGLGEMAMQGSTGKTGNKGEEIAYDALNQITELLPLNPLGNNGDIVSTVMPDALKPLWQIKQNKDFANKPIYRKSSFNENNPEWTKVYKGTSGVLVNLSEWTNELAGGDKYKKAETMESVMNWNPAKVEHLFEAYFGGMATTINQTGKTLWYGTKSAIEGERDDNLLIRNVPVLNRFLKENDNKSEFYKINNKYYKYFNEYDDTKREFNGYKKEASRGNWKIQCVLTP